MKHSIRLIVLIGMVFSNPIKAQDCNCTKDFDELHQLFRKTPAFKDKKAAYEKTYELIKPRAAAATSDYNCLVLLNQLAFGLNDNHINIFGLEGDRAIEIQQSKMNLDSLRQELKAKPFSAIEGIYSLPKYVTLGVYKEQDKYVGVILKSELPNWQPGEIMYTLLPYGEDLLLAIFGQRKDKRVVAVTERIKQGMFLKLGLRKTAEANPFHLAPEPDSLFIRRELNDVTTYIKIGSFSSFYPKLSDAEAFYASLNYAHQKEPYCGLKG